MTEREARALLAEREGQQLCVTYAVKADGSIRFAPEPVAPTVVPVTALTRGRRRAAAVGLGVALAACTPHDNPEVQQPRVQVTEPASPISVQTIPEMPTTRLDNEVLMDGDVAPRPQPVPNEQLVDGGIGEMPMPEPAPMKPGGVEVAPLPPAIADEVEPCEPTQRPYPKTRGTAIARPLRLDPID